MNGRLLACAAGSDDAAVLTIFLLNGTNANMQSSRLTSEGGRQPLSLSFSTLSNLLLHHAQLQVLLSKEQEQWRRRRRRRRRHCVHRDEQLRTHLQLLTWQRIALLLVLLLSCMMTKTWNRFFSFFFFEAAKLNRYIIFSLILLWISSVLGEEEEPYKSSSIQTLGLQVRRCSWNAERMQGEYTFDLETHRYIASVLDLRVTRTRTHSLERTNSSLQIMHRRSINIIKCKQQSPRWWSSSSRIKPKIRISSPRHFMASIMQESIKKWNTKRWYQTSDLRSSNSACRSLLQLIEHVQEWSVFRCNEQLFHKNLRDDDDNEAHQGSKKTWNNI